MMMKSLLTILVLLSPILGFAANLDDHIDVSKTPKSRAGSVVGSIQPKGHVYTLVLRRRGADKSTMCNVGFSSVDSKFKFPRLEPGTYDLMVIPYDNHNDFPVSKDYPILVGQPIEEAYRGTALAADEHTSVRQMVIRRVAEADRATFLAGSVAEGRKLLPVGASYKDQRFDSPLSEATLKLGVLPCYDFLRQAAQPKPMDYEATRTLMGSGGNAHKAFAVVHVQERFIMPSFVKTIQEGGKTRQERVNHPCAEEYQYDELLLLTKVKGQWVVDARRPINLADLIYRVKGYPQRNVNCRNVYYYFEGALVGITVKAQKQTDLGEIIVPRLKTDEKLTVAR